MTPPHREKDERDGEDGESKRQKRVIGGWYGRPKTCYEGSLDHGRVRWYSAPLRMELDDGKAGDDHPSDCYPRFQRSSYPPCLLSTRLHTSRDRRVLVPLTVAQKNGLEQ